MHQSKLEPPAIALAGIDQWLDDQTEGELRQILIACLSVTSTNCWCWSYAAARYLQDEVARRMRLPPTNLHSVKR